MTQPQPFSIELRRNGSLNAQPARLLARPLSPEGAHCVRQSG